MNPLRIGILSTASIVPRFVGAAGTLEDCVITALASRNLARAEEKAALFRIPQAFGSYGPASGLWRHPSVTAPESCRSR